MKTKNKKTERRSRYKKTRKFDVKKKKKKKYMVINGETSIIQEDKTKKDGETLRIQEDKSNEKERNSRKD